jgi:hypothetical protein
VVANTAPGPRDADAKLPPFPRGKWREVSLVPGDLADPDLPRLFLREGAALPLGPLVEWSDQMPLDEIELLVNPDASGHAVGTLYEDAGDGLGYRDRAYRLTQFSFSGGKASATVADGDWPAGSWRVTPRVVAGK